jgi:hypothetical protein
MYVRWQSRKRRKPTFGHHGKLIRQARRYRDRIFARAGTNEPDRHWRAVLVENVRVNGIPTQKHIAYLGGITESAIAIPAQRMFFWDGVLKCLDRLSISKPERNRIVAAVAKKVEGPPSKAERKRIERRRRELLGE